MQQLGLYESLITQLIASNLNEQEFFIGERVLDKTEAATFLSRFLAGILEYAVNSIPTSDQQLQQQITLANDLLFWLKDRLQDEHLVEDNLLDTQGRILTALYRLDNPIADNLQRFVQDHYPQTGLSQSELFSGSHAELSLESELKREIVCANQIYLLVSFIKWSGIRMLMPAFKQFTEQGGQLKIITTTYMGATDSKAIEELARLANTEIKVSYNTQTERLHAKSYLFLRDTGFHTGYIGSSNLSRSALTNGLEWNLKLTTQEIPHVLDKALHTFETYWQSKEFTRFEHSMESIQRLRQSLKQQRTQTTEEDEITFYSITPFSHQQEILDQLQAERELHGRYRNLVVAATGTGKTLISAFDFARFVQDKPDANFLFIAHREEILKQALNSYRQVLRDRHFGQLWVGYYEPENYRQLFASVQTLDRQLQNLRLSEDFYDYIVIDEVHHIAAKSYREIINHFKPKVLLGLTATPERHDGADILQDFHDTIAAEIRLTEAINRRHLCPFQYFLIDDDTDLRSINWSNGRYEIAALTKLYTHHSTRAVKIIQSIAEIITDIKQMRALAFCVSQEHAEYMCKQFLLKGLKSDVLTSKNSQERGAKQQAIRTGEINILCVVDIFNEGIDIPEVDTLLFLRPTESLTIFLQQLGRGLRLAPNKEVCTVLDFIGNARVEYDFSQKFRALIGPSHQSLSGEIKQGFPRLPLGCQIEMTKTSQEIILNNIRKAIVNKRSILRLLGNYSQTSTKPLTLANFLRIFPQVNLNDIYKYGGWLNLNNTNLSYELSDSIKTDHLKDWISRIKNRLLNCDASNYLHFIQELVEKDFCLSDEMNPKLALMLHYDLWNESGEALGFATLAQSIKALDHPHLKTELKALIPLLINQIKHIQKPLPELEQIPLLLHARYARDQILAAFGAHRFEKKLSTREGVLELNNDNIELLFVTLNKNPKQFSPTTMYHDYAISEELFHWQSQNSARPDKGRGLSYVEQHINRKRIFLFVREQSNDEHGNTMGYVNFGEVCYLHHSGSKPMNITWGLRDPMPSFMWHEAAKLAVA
ncbi:MAG: DUF3427 domain-containing protein [Alcaligenaceae bacterium]|nr:DUF3427 domain-containing protein [Alcaligenaceae bacterium]